MVKGLKRLQSVLFAPLAQTGPCVPSLELQYITNSYVERRPGPGLPSSKVQACLLSVKGRRYSARVSARSWLSAMATELQTGTRVSAQVLDTQEAREETAWAPLHACWLAAASKLLANDDLLLDYTSLQSLQSLQLRKSARCSSSFQVHDVCRMNRRTDGAVPPAVLLSLSKKGQCYS